jgi:hypothetical protein
MPDNGWAQHSPGDPWGDVRAGRERETRDTRELLMPEGGEARNHEAEVEAIARAIYAALHPSDSGPIRYQQERWFDAARSAIAVLDAARCPACDGTGVRRSPQGEDPQTRAHEAEMRKEHGMSPQGEEWNRVEGASEEVYVRSPQGEDHELRREISENAPLREKIADELAHNDECGAGPVSWQEYLADADAILRIVAEHGPSPERNTEAGRDPGRTD